MESNRVKLAREITQRSISNEWESAKQEWALDFVYWAEELEHCLCGHPIMECCVLLNKQNNQRAVVGNVCVNKFMGIESDKIFKSVKKIKKNIEKSVNLETIKYAHEKAWINEWEKDFYINIMYKKNLTPKQKAKREQVNNKIITKTSKKQ